MKISVVCGGMFVPEYVDNHRKKYDSAIMLEDENQNYRVKLGMVRDKKLSKNYEPYYSRVLTKQDLIYLRDELTKLIESCQ